MENQPLLDDLGPDLRRRKSAGTSLVARPQYIEAPSPEVIEEPGHGLLLEYWDILRRHRGTLVLIAFLGFLASVLFTLPQTPVYRARASLEIQSLNENFLNMRDVNPTTNEGVSSPAESDLETQVKILQSESVLERVIVKLNLAQRLSAEKGRSRLSAWRKALGLGESRFDSTREELLRQVAKNLTIQTEPKTRLVEILYNSADPQLAADFANTLTAEFIQQNLEARWKTTQQTGEWLTRQMDDVRIKLEKSEDELQSYASASGLLFTSEKDNIAEEKLRQLQEELSKAQADRAARQSKYELASTAPPESLPEVLDDKTLGEYQVKLTDLHRQLAELSSSLTPAHPAVKKVQAQVTTLESALEKERTNVIQRIRNEYESAHRRENLIAANYAAQARLISEQAAKVAHYNILKREVDTNRQLYDSLLRNVQEAGVTSALRASNIRVVDSAQPPTRPYRPILALNAALGLLAGAFFGFIFVVMRERADQSIQAPGETALYLEVPELGVIPSADAEGSPCFAYYHDGKVLEGKGAEDGKRPRQVELVTSQQPPSVLADSFRAALASILYSGQNGDRPRVIVLTSANPREGKTTVASNLALAAAEIGQSVLLIDGDLRKGRLHEIFEVSNAWGLSDLLAGKEPPKGRERMVMATGCGYLFLLPAGSPAPNISSLLYSPRAPEFLTRVRQEFHTIIIDTPPMLHMPDARVLGRLADGVILVVRSAQTTRETAAVATQRLTADGTRVLGTILNEWDPRKTSHPGYGYGYRHYHYDANRG
ncbi:MAG: polysaccharide biosynthesis tyrosine autokinase [Terriglobia bacterium]|jgi:polysaccharide biosynthesis transport protein